MKAFAIRRAAVPVVALGLVVGGGPAQAWDEVTTVPEGLETLTMVGHGFGHGRGMSQWGAYGAAAAYGKSWRSILDFYYTGTRRVTLADSTIRVWISGDNDNNTAVLPRTGLAVSSTAGTFTLPYGKNITGWRAVRGDGVGLQYRDAKGVWRAYASAHSLGDDVGFGAGPLDSRRGRERAMNRHVRVILPSGRSQELRGIVYASLRGGSLRTVLHSTMESYLRSVVPNEMPASWHTQALSAQSVAARTYAAAYRVRQRAKNASWDICDTVSCQVFRGVASYSSSGRTRTPKEFARTDDAIARTAGIVLSTSNGLASTEFSASNGGHTVYGGTSYLKAKRDPYDGAMNNPVHTWTKSVAVTTISRRWGLGTLQSINVLERDGNGDLGGRVQQIQLVGDKRTVTVSGASVRANLGLRSTWFAFRTDSAGRAR